MKKILLALMLLSRIGSTFGGGVFVEGNGTGDVTIRLESRTTILAAIFLAENHTQEGVIAGDLIIKGEGQITTINANAFTGLTSIEGSLVLSAVEADDYDDSQNTLLATINDAAFPDLVSVTGSIFCSGCAVTSLTMNALTSVGQDFRIFSNNALETFSFPQLISIGRDVVITVDPEIETISFPQLTTVGRDLYAHSNNSLVTVSLPQLISIENDVYIHSNSNLTTLSFPQLTTVGRDFYLNGNTALKKTPFNLFDGVVGNVTFLNSGLDGEGVLVSTDLINDLPEGNDKTILNGDYAADGGSLSPLGSVAAAIIKRHPQLTVNVSGKSRNVNTHINTNYDNGDGTYSQKKHSLIGRASGL